MQKIKIIVTDDGYGFPDEIRDTTGFFKAFYRGTKVEGVEIVPEVPECHAPELVVGLCG
jgi:hypothetical protein